MDLNPPAGSKISIASDGADPTIIIPAATSSTRYFTGLFLLFWLGMWTIGFRDAGSKVISGNANGFLMFWLAGWTLGGIFAVVSLYRIFRPSVPESLELKRNNVNYDSGIAPLQFDSSWRFTRSQGTAGVRCFPGGFVSILIDGNCNRCVCEKLTPATA
jgi:hypothetical protein